MIIIFTLALDNLADSDLLFGVFCVVVEPGRSAWKMIVKNFGYEILLEDGHIDRQKLGQIIFQDEAKRKTLNHCTHPYIQRAMLWQVVKHFLRGKSGFMNAILCISLYCTGTPLVYM